MLFKFFLATIQNTVVLFWQPRCESRPKQQFRSDPIQLTLTPMCHTSKTALRIQRGPFSSGNNSRKYRGHQHDLGSCFFPEKIAITLPAIYFKELTLELIKEFDVIYTFAMSYGIIQLNNVNKSNYNT